MSSMYKHAFDRFFGGDIDFVNDAISAVLVNTDLYTIDVDTHTDIDDIPVEAILSETFVAGRYINNFSLFADNLSFENVDATAEVGAVVIFVDSATTDEATLCFYFDNAAEFPFTPAGSSVAIVWPETGLLIS